MTRERPRPNSMCFYNKKSFRTSPQNPSVFSGNCVSASTCDAADRSRTPYPFSRKTRDCKFKCDAPDRFHIPCFLPKKMRFAGSLPIPRVHFPCVWMRLGFTSHGEFTCDAANRSLIPNIFPRPRRRDVKAMLGYLTFKCSQKAGRACEERRCLVMSLTILQNACHSAPKGWDGKGGIPQDACWRRTLWSAPKGRKKYDSHSVTSERNAMKLSLACAQCSVAAWKRNH